MHHRDGEWVRLAGGPEPESHHHLDSAWLPDVCLSVRPFVVAAATSGGVDIAGPLMEDGGRQRPGEAAAAAAPTFDATRWRLPPPPTFSGDVAQGNKGVDRTGSRGGASGCCSVRAASSSGASRGMQSARPASAGDRSWRRRQQLHAERQAGEVTASLVAQPPWRTCHLRAHVLLRLWSGCGGAGGGGAVSSAAALTPHPPDTPLSPTLPVPCHRSHAHPFACAPDPHHSQHPPHPTCPPPDPASIHLL